MRKVTFQGKSYLVPSFDHLKLGESADVQEYLGGDLARLDRYQQGDLRAVIAVLWLAFHRSDPSVTFAEVEALDLDLDAIEVEEVDEEGNPIPPAEGAAGAPPPSSTGSPEEDPESSGPPSSDASTD